jgi:hypothetical protein
VRACSTHGRDEKYEVLSGRLKRGDFLKEMNDNIKIGLKQICGYDLSLSG